MKKIIGTGIGFLFCVTNVNAVELGVDAKSGINSAGVGFVLELSGINYSYPATAAKGYSIDAGSGGYRDTGLGFDYHADSTPVGWSEYPAGFRLTAGMLESDSSASLVAGSQHGIGINTPSAKSDIITDRQHSEASVEKSVSSSSGERSAGRDAGFKLAVGVGVTVLEPDIDLDAELNAGGLSGLDQAELAGLLNQAETETTIDLEDFFVRPVLAIGVNYAF
jgi:hypothetical protein